MYENKKKDYSNTDSLSGKYELSTVNILLTIIYIGIDADCMLLKIATIMTQNNLLYQN